MGHDPDELETRIGRCEEAIFGSVDTSKGLSSRMHMNEVTITKIDATLSRLNWLIIAGVLVGVLNLVLNRTPAAPTHTQQSVQVSAVEDSGKLASARDYLTTADVAKREQVSERAVVDWISQGRIDPVPAKVGKGWIIAKNFRITPQEAACGDETPH